MKNFLIQESFKLKFNYVKIVMHFMKLLINPGNLIMKLWRASPREARIQAAFTDGVAAANPGQETLKTQSVTSMRR